MAKSFLKNLANDLRNSGGNPSQTHPIDRPIEIVKPANLTTPVIFASPHSGRYYPQDLIDATRLDHHALRQSEDSYVDLLFGSASHYGAPLLKALFPRAYVDVNRSPDELDPRMFTSPLSIQADSRSNRVMAGLGVIPRIVADGQNIYSRKLSAQTATARLKACYLPYHQALKELIETAKAKFGVAVVIDCHSMPSLGGVPLRHGEPKIDFVLGDRFGVSCASCLPSMIETFLTRKDYHVVRNAPYAGGYVASTYGRPMRGVHVLQIEMNRALYLDESRITRTAGFDQLRQVIDELVMELVTIDVGALLPMQAAE